ncbi:MAG: lytic murein transglycosylase [Bacteroidetes bacterium]|nr:lytic murein transglycosylase [Bacteroidota bacterium]
MLNKLARKILRSVDILVISIAVVIAATVRISYSSFYPGGYDQKAAFFKPVIDRLIKKGADSSFIFSMINDKRTKFNERYVKINVTGYLKKVDYSSNYNAFSIRKSRQFIRENRDILNKCEDEFGVPKEVITSILWVETKHGSYLGDNHIASVYLSTAMCDQPEFVELNKKELHETFVDDTSELSNLEKKISERARKKSRWAVNELIYLSKINNAATVPVLDLNGSWAGAFGLSQFLPSSYFNWAVDGNGDGVIDLFNTADAIYSVANYLKQNGWSDSYNSWKKAIYHYNNSNDYVDAILKLASKLEISSIRGAAMGTDGKPVPHNP